MNKRLILIHGRNFKPNREFLLANWKDALRSGLERDYPKCVDAFDALTSSGSIEMAHYGDKSNKFLSDIGREYEEKQNILDRKACLTELKKLTRDQLLSKSFYGDRPGKSSYRKALADALHRPLEWLGVADNLISRVAPDVKEYWNPDSQFGSDVRWPLTKLLSDDLSKSSDVLLISHSLGSMIAHDVMWKLTYYHEYDRIDTRVNVWVTLGSPLGNPTVQDNLKGSRAKHARRYPRVGTWINMAAEDDYISHDQTLADDFRLMRSLGMVERITDKRVYNMALRGLSIGNAKSNPHHGVGYLISPHVADVLRAWLTD